MRLSALVLCVVLLIPSIFSICKFDSSPYYESAELYNELLLELFGGIEEPEERLSKQEIVLQTTELKKLSDWDTLSLQSRLDLLQLLADIEAYDLRIPTVPLESTKLISYATLATYGPEKKIITIDLQHVNVDTAFECVRSVIHEMRHHMQHQFIEVIDFSNEASDSCYFDQIRNWREEFLNYNSGYGSEEDYEAYASQSCEEDARAYSNEQTQLIFAWLNIPVEQNMIDKGE